MTSRYCITRGSRRASGRFRALVLCGTAFILPLICSAAPAVAQVAIEEDDETAITTYRMTVSPAAEPDPAFRYRLLKHENDRRDGNAAPFYYRAQIGLDAILRRLHDEFGDAYDDWIRIDRTPIAELPKEKAKEALRHFNGSVMDGLDEATSRAYCDWGWNVRNIRGPEVFQFLLPEIQQARALSRMLALQTRVAIAETRFHDALEFTQMNYQLGRDTGKPTFLVCGLVGLAIAGISNQHVLELIAAPDAPNLYWALAELPRPLIDLRPAMRFELGVGPRVFPLLEDAEETSRTPEEWARFIGEAWLALSQSMGAPEPAVSKSLPEALRSPAWETARARLIGVATGLWAYTRAKRALIESGLSVDKVEAMPVGQVIAVQASRAYRHTADAMEKLWYMPFPEMRRRNDAIEKALRREGYMGSGRNPREIIPIASLLVPATTSARIAQERLRRDMAALQVIEALRMHGAQKGEFPAALADVTIVPVPRNPATGMPFVYHTKTVDGRRVAVLELPATDGFSKGKRYEITLRK